MNLFLPYSALAAKRQLQKVSQYAAERAAKLCKIDWLQMPAAVWRSLAAILDFATRLTSVLINTVNPGPSGGDAETSANLAMSDHLFRARFYAPGRIDPLTSGPELSASSLICLI